MRTKVEINEGRRIWYSLNKEKVLAGHKLWKENHQEQIKISQHKCYVKHKKQNNEYRIKNREHIKEVRLIFDTKLKNEIFTTYSNGIPKCIRCGFDDIRALQLDHINGGGTKHRRDLRMLGGGKFYRWIKDNNYPTGYQVLCANCNWIKRHENHEHYKTPLA